MSKKKPEMLNGPGTLFEHELTVYVRPKYQADKRMVEKDGPKKSSCAIKLRVIDPEDFEPVVATLRGCSVETAREWIEDLTGLEKGRLDGVYKDHKVTFTTMQGRVVGSIDNCDINAFDLDHVDLGITFKVIGYDVSKKMHGEIATSVGERLLAKFERAGHWMPPQQELVTKEGEAESGDAEQQESITVDNDAP